MTIDLMTMMPAIAATFLASMVEAIEAMTIVLSVGTVRGWRSAAIGAAVGFVALAVIIAALGPPLNHVPLGALRVAIGVLLLLFGMRWLRKAILRAGGVIPLHDEDAIYARETRQLRLDDETAIHARETRDPRWRGGRPSGRFDWVAAVVSGKAVLLEGLEVVFIVIAVSAGTGLLAPAIAGALAACAVVVAAGFALRRPLARIPENTLKFAVGVMLSAFGVFWTGEGLGVPWPGGDLSVVGFGTLFLCVGLATAALIRRPLQEIS